MRKGGGVGDEKAGRGVLGKQFTPLHSNASTEIKCTARLKLFSPPSKIRNKQRNTFRDFGPSFTGSWE